MLAAVAVAFLFTASLGYSRRVRDNHGVSAAAKEKGAVRHLAATHGRCEPIVCTNLPEDCYRHALLCAGCGECYEFKNPYWTKAADGSYQRTSGTSAVPNREPYTPPRSGAGSASRSFSSGTTHRADYRQRYGADSDPSKHGRFFHDLYSGLHSKATPTDSTAYGGYGGRAGAGVPRSDYMPRSSYAGYAGQAGAAHDLPKRDYGEFAGRTGAGAPRSDGMPKSDYRGAAGQAGAPRSAGMPSDGWSGTSQQVPKRSPREYAQRPSASDARSLRELLQECKRLGIDTTGAIEREDVLKLLKEHETSKPRASAPSQSVPAGQGTQNERASSNVKHTDGHGIWHRFRSMESRGMDAKKRRGAAYLLDLSPLQLSFSTSEINSAYKRAAMECHPDRPHNKDRQDEATAVFKMILTAKETLESGESGYDPYTE
eukprot:TRINITY_DN29112_c0_g1_i1.p1 TRINITY_DN29112_c0_g1~~TRINITY_DN29112_c0_g1_i1.p1  ORF type:complete len:429 (-),score=9.51 TRINITY_DN29112_c0_g1_i1:181-1467(-)